LGSGLWEKQKQRFEPQIKADKKLIKADKSKSKSKDKSFTTESQRTQSITEKSKAKS